MQAAFRKKPAGRLCKAPRVPTVWEAENDDRVDRTLFSYDRVRVRQARPVFYSLSECSTRLLITCSYLVLTQQRLGTPENYFACMHARHVATAYVAPLRSAPASRSGAPPPPKTAYDLTGRRHGRTPRTFLPRPHIRTIQRCGTRTRARALAIFLCHRPQVTPLPWHARYR